MIHCSSTCDIILIIEDDNNLSGNLVELLELAGYKVYAACNGKDGLAFIRKLNPDLVLCDIVMPQLDGYGVLRAMRNIPETAGIPFIFLTGKSELRDIRNGMDQGADDYLVKPFSGDDLLRVVETRLNKKRLLKKEEKNYEILNDSDATIKTFSDINALSSRYKVKKIKQKCFVFMAGDNPNFLYFIIKGKVKTYRTTDDGKEFLNEIYRCGDFFGYVALMTDGEYKESASTLEDSEIGLIPRHDFFNMLRSNQEASLHFIKLISNNLAGAEEKLVRLAYNSARKRVAEALVFLCRKYNCEGKENFPFPANRENISGIACVTPESVSRNISHFKEEGLIEIGLGTIKIINLRKMEALKN